MTLAVKYDTLTGEEYAGLLEEESCVFDPSKVKVSVDDTTANYLEAKLVAGSGISLTVVDDGADETLEISSTADTLPSGAADQSLRYDGSAWTANSILKIESGGIVVDGYVNAGNSKLSGLAGTGTRNIAADSSGNLVIDDAGLGALEYWTENRNVTSPNATVPAHQFIVTGTETNIDAVISPKGSGAILAQVPDGTAAGGDKRGEYTVDLQMGRFLSSQVANSNYDIILGGDTNKTAIGYTHQTIVGGKGNTVIGSYSALIAGWYNTIRADYGVLGGGYSNIVYEDYGFVGGGYSNFVNGEYSSIVGGLENEISGDFSAISGGAQAKASQFAQQAHAGGRFASQGDAQRTELVFRRSITNSTGVPTYYELFLDNISERYVLPNYSAFNCFIQLTARQTNGSGILLHGLYSVAISRGANAASTSVWSIVTLDESQSGTNIYLTSITGDTTNGSLLIRVQVPDGYAGQAVAIVRTAETFASS